MLATDAQRRVSERQRAEQALRQSKKRFANAFQAGTSGKIITKLPTGQILDVNDAFVRLTSYTLAELFCKTTLELEF